MTPRLRAGKGTLKQADARRSLQGLIDHNLLKRLGKLGCMPFRQDARARCPRNIASTLEAMTGF